MRNCTICICILWGGTCPLHIASAEAASRASPMHDLMGGTSVYCRPTPSGWPNGVCEVYSELCDLCTRNGLLQPTCLQSPLKTETCIKAKGEIRGEKWRDPVPSVYSARPIITVSLTSLVPLNSGWTSVMGFMA